MFFDPNRATRLSTDASRGGIRFVLQQEQSDQTRGLVQEGLGLLTKAESQYAIIELELLIISWAIANAGTS